MVAFCVYVCAVTRCSFGQNNSLFHPISPQAWLSKPAAESLAASGEVFGAEKPKFMLAEVVLHRNHRDAALTIKLTLSY
jgi:hypothetical protein